MIKQYFSLFIISILINCVSYLNAETYEYSSPKDTVSYAIEGQIKSKKGKLLEIKIIEGIYKPFKGLKGSLQRYIEIETAGIKTSGWFEIGTARVNNSIDDKLSLYLTEIIEINHENYDTEKNLKVGNIIKFVWQEVITQDKIAYSLGITAYYDSRNKKIARFYFKEALSVNPNNHEAINMLGFLKLADEEYDSALFLFKKALKIQPNSSIYHSNLATNYFHLGNYKEAFNHAFQAVILDDNNAEAYFIKAVANYMAFDNLNDDDKVEILVDIDRAITLKPKVDYYFVQRSKLRYLFGKTEGACEDAKKAKTLGSKEALNLIRQYCN